MKLALHHQIFIALVVGIVWSFSAKFLGLSEFTVSWIAPFGTLFINLLKLIAIPLVITSLVEGISGLKDMSSLSKMGTWAIGTYLITTVLAICIGLALVNIMKPGNYLSAEKREGLRADFANQAESTQVNAEKVRSVGPLQPLVDIVPQNLFQSLSNNLNMLQAVFFAVFLGVCIVGLEGKSENIEVVTRFFSGMNDVILKMVDLIMRGAPLGVFALLAGLSLDLELVKALSMYSFTVLLGLLLVVGVVYPFIYRLGGGKGYFSFFKALSKAQMLAFSTSSSSATLPVTMDCVRNNMGVSEEVSSFVLPLGATINMDGTSLYQAVATVFIAQSFGIELDLGQQLTIVVTAVLASVGSAGVPGAGMVMLSIVLQSVNLDPAGIALVVAVDRVLDMCRTLVNVSGDGAVAFFIQRISKK